MTSAICAAVLPALYVFTGQWGAIGTAAAMFGYQFLWLVVCATLLRSLIGGREWRLWVSVDMLLPQLLIVSVVAAAKTIAPDTASRDVLFLVLAATWIVAAALAGLAMPMLREQGLGYLRYLRRQSFRPAG
jgi:hypothetical protein